MAISNHWLLLTSTHIPPPPHPPVLGCLILLPVQVGSKPIPGRLDLSAVTLQLMDPSLVIPKG